MILTKAYMALDNFLVDRANDAVKAWNWTTGRTRADLANLMSGLGSSSVSAAPFVSENYTFTRTFMPICFSSLFLINYFINNYIDKKESKLDCIKDLRVEMHKKNSKKMGLLFGILGCANTTEFMSNAENKEMKFIMYGIGDLLISGSHYVMRADYQKPQKDCVRRGLEKLTEIVQDWQATTEPIPIRARYEQYQEQE